MIYGIVCVVYGIIYMRITHRYRIPTASRKLRDVLHPRLGFASTFHYNGSTHNEGVVSIYIELLTIGEAHYCPFLYIRPLARASVYRALLRSMPTRVVVADDHIGLNIAFAGNEDISSRFFEHRKKVVYHYLSGKLVFDGS